MNKHTYVGAELNAVVEILRQILTDKRELTADEARQFVSRAPARFGRSLTDFGGMIHTGQGEDVKEQPKGCFTRTTYADRLENETEFGWKATAYRLMRNIVRNFDEKEGMSTEAEQAERRGFNFLTQRFPNNPRWVFLVDLDNLDMNNARLCVLGQLAEYLVPTDVYDPHFDAVLDYFGVDEDDSWAIEHGFDRSNSTSYSDLREAWLKILTEARAELEAA